MFRSRKKNRRRERSKSAHSRRLAIELMEGRMMLSAAGLEAPQPLLDVTGYSIWPAKINSTDIKYSSVQSDGGLVQVMGLSTDLSISHPDLASDITGSLRFNSVPVAGFDRADVSSNHETWHLLSTQVFDGVGIIGRSFDVIPAWNNNDSPVINLTPVVIGPAPNPSLPAVSEGGAIPIHAIFADFRKDTHFASGVKVVSSPAAETSVASLASARQLSTPDAAIAGEWARATVFEIAGGEPATTDSQSNSGDNAQRGEPLSSIAPAQQGERRASRHGSDPSNDGAPPTDSNQSPAAQPTEDVAAAVSQLLNTGKLVAGSTGAGVPQFPADMTLNAGHPDAALAAASVFDQLGEENAAVIESSVYGKTWLRSIGASPLLMVLALERIAALNSRRATRESRIVAAKTPVRSRK